MGFDETRDRGKDNRSLILHGHLGVSDSYGNQWLFIFRAPLCNWVQVPTDCRADHTIGGKEEETDASGMIPAVTRNFLSSLTTISAAVEEQPTPAMRIPLEQRTPGKSCTLVSNISPSVTWFNFLPVLPALSSELRWYSTTSRKTTK